MREAEHAAEHAGRDERAGRGRELSRCAAISYFLILHSSRVQDKISAAALDLTKCTKHVRSNIPNRAIQMHQTVRWPNAPNNKLEQMHQTLVCTNAPNTPKCSKHTGPNITNLFVESVICYICFETFVTFVHLLHLFI